MLGLNKDKITHFSLFGQFFSQSCSGQNLFETLRDSEKTLRLQSGEIHTRICRNSKHNCSTQTDVCSREEEVCRDTCDSLENSSGCSSHSHHKPFSPSSQHTCSVSTSHSPSEPHPVLCYRRQDLSPHPPTFTPVLSDGNSTQSSVDGQSFPLTAGGGTWPKVLVGASISEANPLSVFKKPKQRKSIFDVAGFRRPEAKPHLDYMSQISKHSPQSSVCDPAQTPPTPPARSDSFRFKHRQQNSSASDSTITNGTPPASVAQSTSPQDEGLVGNQLYYINTPPEKIKNGLKKHLEDEGGRRRAEVQEKRRYRPKSAPALRRNMTPLHIPAPMQVSDRPKSLV